MRTERGFTLIELLIAISIIAVLSIIGLVAFTAFVKNARDARRQSDLKIIQSALEEYFADQKFYPPSMNFTTTFALTNATGLSPAPPVSKTYLNNVPIGPTSSSEYQYKALKRSGVTWVDCAGASPCYGYCLYAKSENLTQSVSPCTSNNPDSTVFKLEVTSP